MREYFRMAIFIGSSLIVLPLLVLIISGTPIGAKDHDELQQVELTMEEKKDDIMEEETLVGILAKEIPYTYEKEAIKAQAVIERTYMARRILGIQNKGGIVGYTVEEMKGLWGESYDKNYSIYQQAVEETRGKLILFNNQPIEALYHKASSGKTRDASEVYGVDVPYLKGVDSHVDTISKQMTYTKKEVKNRILAAYESFAVPEEELAKQIQIVDKDDAGYVKMLQIGNITIKGEEFRKLLELPSCAFKIYESKEKLIFDVRGIGNGVGLSQNGANELAKQGGDYEQILHAYYTEIEIGDYEFQK